jgi:hypothetical protein
MYVAYEYEPLGDALKRNYATVRTYMHIHTDDYVRTYL